jgi:hypothetical protein
MALTLTVYEDSNGIPTLDEAGAIADLLEVNQLWSQCNIGFQIENYNVVRAEDQNLNYQPANLSELNTIRNAFDNNSSLLIVITGAWNRTGTLGSSGANAWANMPGSGIYGVVMEKPVATYPNIMAHELGHYLNLDHTSNASNLMNPVIYSTSTQLSTSQCQAARSAVNYYWGAMKRS